MREKKVCVIGLGYIGLPTAALLASRGYLVSGYDINNDVVNTINQGYIHIVEKDLDYFVEQAVKNGQLKAFPEPQQSDIYIICVPTPFHQSTEIPSPNIDYVIEAAKKISKLLKKGDMVIIESTCPVGTTEKIFEIILDHGFDHNEIYIAYCPERVLPGNIMEELVTNNRIIGGVTDKSTKRISLFYEDFVKEEVLQTDHKTAEMCKLAENSFRDVNIAFANELSLICDKEGIDVWSLIKLANRHPRVDILQPGVGVGGHCIAVDPWFIASRDHENSRIIRCAREINLYKTEWAQQKIQVLVDNFINENRKRPRIACLGVSFKPNIDDLRESPALELVNKLSSLDLELFIVEPNINRHAKFKIHELELALDQAHIIVVLVKHEEFLGTKIIEKIKQKPFLDFCGIIS